jgi:hypothetical protein
LENKKRSIGLLLSGGRSPNTAMSAVDYFEGHGRIFLIESFLGRKNKNISDHDYVLTEKLKTTLKDLENSSLIVTNAPLSFPPCYSCNILPCPGKDDCTVSETRKILDLYNELKKTKKNLKKFMPYTQRYCDLKLRELFPKINAPHEAMGSNLAQISSRFLHIRKIFPHLTFKEAYPQACIFRLLSPLGLNSNFLNRYKDIQRGAGHRELFLKRLEQKTGIFVYDVDMSLIIKNIHVFESLVLAVCGVLDLMQKTEALSDCFILPQEDLSFM